MEKNRRIISIWLVLSMLLSMLPQTAWAAAEEATASGSCGENLTWCFEESTGTLTISGNGSMDTYSESNPAPWYDRQDEIKTVNIQSGVDSISGCAFADCSNIVSISIPDTVCSISSYAFKNCAALTNINIPDEVQYINMGTFLGCSSLQAISLPDNLLEIGYEAFRECESLTNISIPSGVTKIEDEAFYHCTGLETIDFSSDELSMEGGVFNGCSSLKTISIPEGTITIGNTMFADCISLEHVDLPDSVTLIDIASFSGCTSLKNIVIPDKVTTIKNAAFDGCSNLSSVTIPASVAVIETAAFGYCDALADVYYLGTEEQWAKITIDDFNDSLLNSTIHCEQDDDSSGETSHVHSYTSEITVPTCTEQGYTTHICTCGDSCVDSYVEANGHSFGEWYETVAATTETEGEERRDCANCDAYETQVIAKLPIEDDTEETIGGTCGNNLTWTLINGVLTVSGIGEMKNFTATTPFPEWADYTASYNCVTSFVVNEGVTSIGEYAFAYASAAISVTLPQSVTSIGASAFHRCSSITDVYYAGSEEEWGTITIGANNEYLTNATIHYNSTGPGSGNTGNGYVRYFAEWDDINKIAYFDTGSDDVLNFGGQVTEETDTSFIDKVENLVGTYVLVETKPHTDGMLLPDTVISIKPLATKTGVITSVGEYIAIDGNEYEFELLDGLYIFDVNDTVMYHLYNNVIISITVLESYQEPDSGSSDNSTSQPEFDYDAPPYDPSNEEELLRIYAEEWLEKYDEYIEAVKEQLNEAAGSEEAVRAAAINAEADRMQTEDSKSGYSKYINFTGTSCPYKTEAYTALATLLYDEGADQFDFGKEDVGGELINEIMQSLYGSKQTIQYGNVEVYINIIQGSDSKFGNLKCTNIKTGQTFDAVICSTQDEINETINSFCDELAQLATNSKFNIYKAIVEDILDVELSSFEPENVMDKVDELASEFLVDPRDLMKDIGVGQLFDTIEKCYNYFTDVEQNAQYCNKEGLEKLTEEDKQITFDEADTIWKVQRKLSALQNATDDLNELIDEYISGNLEVSDWELTWKSTFKCPVTVAVYSSDGTQIGYVSDEECWFDSSIKIVKIRSEKTIYSFTKDPLSFKVTANDYGVMNCSFEEYDGNSTPIGRLNFYDIALLPAQEFTTTLENNLLANSKLMSVKTDNKAILADEYVSSGDFASVEISCELETDDSGTGGLVLGEGIFAKGDTVTLRAVPDAGYEFAGWYADDTSVSNDRVYVFTAQENRMLTAKFVLNNNVCLDILVEGTGTVSGAGEYRIGDSVTIRAEPGENYKFVGWYQNSALISTEAEYELTVSESILMVAVFESYEHMIHIAATEWSADSYKHWHTCTGCDELLDAAAHSGGTATCSALAVCEICGSTYGEYGKHLFENDSCVYCSMPGGSCGEDMQWVINTESGTLTISGTGAMQDYALGGKANTPNTPWYDLKDSITGIEVSEGVTHLGNWAFCDLLNADWVHLPKTLTTMGSGCLASCASLTEIEIPDTVESIGNSGFNGCQGLVKLEVPAGISRIEPYLFYDCTNLTEVIFPDTITSIGEYAFAECEKLPAVTIPENVSYIGSFAFSGCDSITEITIPEGVETVEYGTFYACSSLKSIVLPQTITAIGDCAFEACTSLQGIVIPKSVTRLENSVFCGCTSLTEITIPQSVTEIGSGLFRECSALTSVTIQGAITALGNQSFYMCTNLEQFVIPESVVEIGSSVFGHCTNLKSIVFPESVQSIAPRVFDGSGIEEIIFEGNAPTFSTSAFSGISSGITATAYYPGGNETWTDDVLQDYGGTITWIAKVPTSGICGENLTWEFDADTGTLTISGTGAMYDYAVDEVTGLITHPWREHHETIAEVVIQEGATTIGNYAFCGLTRLTGLTLPDTLVSIGERAFCECSALRGITIPASVETIGTAAFLYCSALYNITVHYENPFYSSGAFGCLYNKDKTLLIAAPGGEKYQCVIPETVTEIAEGAFEGCNVGIVEIPGSIKKIPDNAFKDCTNLSEVLLLSGVESIGNMAFAGCSDLDKLLLPDTLTSIGENAFENCTRLSYIRIPSNVHTINDGSFAGCTNLQNIYFEGDAPNFLSSDTSVGPLTFNGVNTLAYYPAGNETWTDEVMQDYGGTVTWEAYDNHMTWSFDEKSGTLTVSGDGDMPGYPDSDYAPWSVYQHKIERIVIEEGITGISYNTFRSCYSVVTVKIPASVTYIDYNAFSGGDWQSFTFAGNAPNGLGNLSCTDYTENSSHIIFYPANNDTWTEEVMSAVEADVIWMPYDASETEGTCGEGLTWSMTVSSGTLTISGSGSMDSWDNSETFAPWIYFMQDINNVVVEYNVQSIGSFAFGNCSAASIRFLGDAPVIKQNAFFGLNAILYYPEGNTTWTPAIRAQYGGNVEWVAHGSVVDQLQQIAAVRDTMTMDEIRTAVQNLDFDALLKAMRAAEGLDYISNLSIADGVYYSTEIGPGIPIRNSTFNTVYGLNLNNVVSQDSVRLTVPATSISVPVGYDSSSAIPISISLDALGENRTLAVPVIIDLIVDETVMNPNFIHIFHREHETGALEEIPVFDSWSKVGWCVQFVIDGEGDYVIAVPENALLSGTCGDNATWTYDYNGKLTISGTGDVYDYDLDANRPPWYDVRENVQTIEIADRITGLGDYALYDCRFADSFAIPASVTTVGNGTFESMGEIIFHFLGDAPEFHPDAFRYVHGSAVYYHSDTAGWNAVLAGPLPDPYNLVFHPVEYSGTCGDNLIWSFDKETGTLVISGTGDMTDFSYSVSEQAPWTIHSQDVRRIIVEEGVTSIGRRAFQNCENTEDIQLADSITTIVEGSINLGTMTEFTIPAGVTGFSSLSIAGRPVKFHVNPKNTTFIADEDGVVFTKDMSTLVCYPSGKVGGYTVPEGVSVIDGNAFQGADLEWLSLPDSLTDINYFAFGGITGLTEITIPQNVTSIAYGAFNYCSDLKSVVIGKCVQEIGGYVFSECNKLSEITFLGDAPIAIDSDAFNYVEVTAYYPADNETWTTDVIQNYGGNITWVAVSGEPEKIDLSGTAMTLGNSLSMDFGINTSKLVNGGEGHYALITKYYADGREPVVTRVDRADWKAYSGSVYTASCNGIAAKEMCDEVEIVVYNADGYAVTNTYTDSVKSYAMRTLNNTNNQSKTELLTTIVDMLNYGAAAQQVFSYDTANLANADLTEAQKAMATAEINPSDARVKGPGYAGSTLTLESQILLDLVFFDSTIGTDFTGMYAIATYTDHYGNAKEVRTDEFKVYASGYHYVSVSGMAVADCSSVVSCTIYNSNGEKIASASDSVEGYIARQLASGRTDAIYTAILKFAASAYNYFH